MIRYLAIAALAAVSGCGTAANDGSATPIQTAQALIGGLFSGPGEVVDFRTALTRDQINEIETSIMFAEIPLRGSQAIVAPVLANGDRLTWGSADGITLTMRGPFVVSTRGLGGDLFGAEVSGTAAVLRRGGTSVRTHDLITGNDDVESRPYNCEITVVGPETISFFGQSYNTTRVSEVCRDDRRGYENIYWLDPDGTMRKSQQWISDDVHYLLLERLK